MTKSRTEASVVILSALLMPAPSNGATQTSNLGVSMQVTAECSLGGGSLDFGSHSNLVTVRNASAVLTVNCTNTSPYNIILGDGLNKQSTMRRMKHESSSVLEYIDYVLYTTAVRDVPWEGATAVAGTGTGADQTVTVYGQVPVQSAPALRPGTYRDTVTITIEY